jgi:hypothetical protein
VDAYNGGVEAQNVSPWKFCRLLVADSHRIQEQIHTKVKFRIRNLIQVKSWIGIRIKAMQIRNPAKKYGSCTYYINTVLVQKKKTHLEFFISEGKFQLCLLILHEGEDQVVVPAQTMDELTGRQEAML